MHAGQRPEERPSSAAEVSQWAQRLRAALNGGDATEALGLVSATAATAVVPAHARPSYRGQHPR